MREMAGVYLSRTGTWAASLILALLLCSLAMASSAQETAKHEIDAWLERAPDSSTTDMIESHRKAIAMWEREISSQFQSLLAIVASDQRDSLRRSHESWPHFKEAEFRTIEQVMSKSGGTLAGPTALAIKLQVVRARALELQLLKDQLR